MSQEQEGPLGVLCEESKHPRVFISHASSDKDRFVLGFAETLRQKGIDAWLDKWELLPGDSLVDKVFEEGLKHAAAVIVVISENSVQSKWVREELNSAFIKRVQTNCRLIPVIIDDCVVPEALKSTLWERITDLEKYDAEFDRIVAAVFGNLQRPPLGPLPGYACLATPAVPGIERIDALVLKLAGDALLQGKHSCAVVSVKAICDALKDMDASEEQVFESVEVLEQSGYIKSSGRWWFQVGRFGFGQYLENFRSSFADDYQSICSEIVNHGRHTDTEIADASKVPRPIVQHVIDDLDNKGMLQVSRTNSGYSICDVYAQFRRQF
jgi:hypothetical protein